MKQNPLLSTRNRKEKSIKYWATIPVAKHGVVVSKGNFTTFKPHDFRVDQADKIWVLDSKLLKINQNFLIYFCSD